MEIAIRAAREPDAAALRALIRGEPRMNPTGLDWPNFVVAEAGGAIAGVAQLRPCGGAVELGSLVVRRDLRGRGLAGRLIEAALARTRGPVFVVTAARSAGHYAPWGFRPVPPWRAPPAVVLNFAVGQAATLLRLLHGQAPRRMAVLGRPAASGGVASRRRPT